MHYLYGDSTPSPLTSNFLEFLRDAIDFSVFVLGADERIKLGRSRIRALEEESSAELERLLKFIAAMQDAIDDADKGEDDGPTARCATQLKELVANAERAAAERVRSDTAAAITQVEADEAALRAECAHALATLLVPHDPPDASTFTRIALAASGRYEATRAAKSGFGLEWTLELGIPEGPWSTPLRVERLAAHLEIRAPQLSGWISKEVKTRPQRLERHVVVELTLEGDALRVRLRTEPAADTGFDIVVDAGSVKATRAAPAEEGASGPFELHPDDYVLLGDFGKTLRASVQSFERRALVSATVEDGDFQAMPSFVPFVERLVGMMAPIVRDIDVRSLTAAELIIRRPLSDDRREEIFVAKSTLREKYAPLGDALRAVFAPLRLEDVPPARVTPPSLREPLAARAELAPSRPPPPPKPRGTLPPPSAVPPPANPPTPSPAPTVVSAPPDSSAPEREGRNEALVGALKKIFTLARAGRVEEAYRKYAELYASEAFAGYPVDDQREALRVMVHAKSHPQNSDAVVDAHRAALLRIKALVDSQADPVDYEMLGVTQLKLDDNAAANAAFEIGLKLERTRDPQSELCGELAKRLGHA
jgi:hypothetical protein